MVEGCEGSQFCYVLIKKIACLQIFKRLLEYQIGEEAVKGNKIYFGEPVRGYIVASTSLGERIDLDEASATLDNAIFEPEQFPFLIYRMDEPKVVVYLFASGKLVCSGTHKTKKDMCRVIQQLRASFV